MKKLLFLSALLLLACSSDLFAQDYMKMRKKQLRIEHQKKLKLIDSLSQELSLSNKKSQNLQSDLNNTSSDLMLTSDSLKNSNLEITQLEAKLLISKNELSLLGSEIDNLVKESSNKTNLISDKNSQIDSLRTSLISFKNYLAVSRDSTQLVILEKNEIIESISNPKNNKGTTSWEQISNIENSNSYLNKFKLVKIQNKPLEISICWRSNRRNKTMLLYDKGCLEGGGSGRLKKRGSLIVWKDNSTSAEFQFLLKDDKMVMKYYEADGDLEFNGTFKKVSNFLCK
jgi:hypothetical protein